MECCSSRKGGSSSPAFPFIPPAPLYHGTWAVRRAGLCGAVFSAQQPSAANSHGSHECTPGAALRKGQKPQLAAGCWCGCLGAGSRIYKTSRAGSGLEIGSGIGVLQPLKGRVLAPSLPLPNLPLVPWNVGHASCRAVWGCVFCAAALSSQQPQLLRVCSWCSTQGRPEAPTSSRLLVGVLGCRFQNLQDVQVPALAWNIGF